MPFLRASNYKFFLEGWTIAHTSWYPHTHKKKVFQYLEFLLIQNPESQSKSSFELKTIRFHWPQAKYKVRCKNAWYRGKIILQDGKYSGPKTLPSLSAHIMTYALRWMSFMLAQALLPLLQGHGGAHPLIQKPWFIHFHCTSMTLSVPICFFPTYEKWYCIKAKAELQTAFLSLPKPVCVICKSNNNKDSKVYYSASLDFPVSFCVPYRYSSELRAETT